MMGEDLGGISHGQGTVEAPRGSSGGPRGGSGDDVAHGSVLWRNGCHVCTTDCCPKVVFYGRVSVAMSPTHVPLAMMSSLSRGLV